jgi:heat shock protein HslJ
MVLAACGDDGSDTETGLPGDDGSTDTTEEPAAAEELVGRSFVSVAVTEDGAERQLADGTEIELNFPDDAPAIGWSAGCNQFGAGLEVEGDVLVVAEPEGTLMGCDDERHTQDEWLTDFLTSEPTWSLDDETLMLTGTTDGSGAAEGADTGEELDAETEPTTTTVIELVEQEGGPGTGGPADSADDVIGPDDGPADHDAGPPSGLDPAPAPALDGRTWVVTELLDGDTVSPVDPGVEATLSISGGQLSLEACNGGGSQIHEITDDEIEVDPPITTMMACGPPLDDVERAMVAVLDGRIGYTVEGDRLILTHPDGHGLVLTAQG